MVSSSLCVLSFFTFFPYGSRLFLLRAKNRIACRPTGLRSRYTPHSLPLIYALYGPAAALSANPTGAVSAGSAGNVRVTVVPIPGALSMARPYGGP